MRSLRWKSLPLALVASMSFLTSCSDNDSNGGDDNDEVETLKRAAALNVIPKAGIAYKPSGEYIVEAGATLNIEADVKTVSVYDDIVDYILVKWGAKINAMGTANAPIVMVSEKEEPGAWSGTYICGRVHTNAEGGKGGFEIGGAVYGDDDDADNSGRLQYVRVEYTGYAFDERHETNGIMFYGVDNGTIVDHCQAYKDPNDGFEFFGGSINVNNMVVVGCSDDSPDWTEGWSGKDTNLVAYREPKATLDYDRDCLTEADNNENDDTTNPIPHPTLKNLIFVGNGESEQGIRLYRGAQVHTDNARVCGKGQPSVIESALTNGALKNGTSLLANITISAELTTDGGYTDADFTVAAGSKMDAALSYASSDVIKMGCDWVNGNWVR